MVPDGNRLIVFGSQIIGVLIVIAGVLTQQAELRSPRPIGKKTPGAVESGRMGDRFARLWDDPLEGLLAVRALESGKSSVAVAGSPTAHPSEETAVRNESESAPAESGIVLWNILDERPFPEVKERRLRIRYAIVSALVTAGYLPLRDSTLSPLFRPADGSSTSKENLIGYFETFKADDGAKLSFPRVCLVWTAKRSTAVPLDGFLCNSVLNQISKQGDLEGNASVRILHHGSSDDLTAYLTQKDRSQDQKISFMRATMPWPKPLQSLRPIITDDQLVQELARELSLRIPNMNKQDIVVFTESDTSYSRQIESELNEQMKDKAKLRFYSYLRGLDGRQEDSPAPSKTETNPSDEALSSLLRGSAISESSQGTSQFDYLRRLALEFERKDKAINKRHICAVGVLGSDIYDKMLVLEAVRPELPAAVFFTTDLDAIYLERQYEDFTRNLVVASAAALDPIAATSPTTSLPPMRDSYQTVLVEFVRNILGVDKSERMQPELFEIVAGRSINLASPQHGAGESSIALPAFFQFFALPIFLLGLGNGFLILWAVSTRISPKAPAEHESAPMTAGARRLVHAEVVLASFGIILIFGLLLWYWNTGRPLLWGEPIARGASIWPGVLIRLFAFLVAILLLLNASHSFVSRSRRLRQSLQGALPSQKQLPLADPLGTEAGAFVRAFFSEQRAGWREKTLDQVLQRIFDHKARRTRIMIASFLYLVISGVLFTIWPPAVPARGLTSFVIEKVILSLGVALYIIHLIYCLDLHLSALTLLRTLRSFYTAQVRQRLGGLQLKTKEMLEAVSELTLIIGRTLLYPLTVLILIILSRLRIFDNWTMTPSLTITFALGALLLMSASIVLWLQGSRLKKTALQQVASKMEAESARKPTPTEEQKKLDAVNQGVFATWYQQPIFAAIFSAVAVFGSLSIAEPLARMLFR